MKPKKPLKIQPWRSTKSRLGKEFSKLAIKEAIGTITDEEKSRLEELDKARL